MTRRSIEIWVGVMMVLGFLALAFLALKVSGLTPRSVFDSNYYEVTAQFDNIGSLKLRSPVRIGGVQIGRVSSIELDPETFKAIVHIQVRNEIHAIPSNSSATIASSGLLGDNYVSMTPGYAQGVLKPGDEIITTYSATSLKSLISTFIGEQKK